MKKQYLSPQLELYFASKEDIMNGSDVDIDVSELFDEAQN